MNLPRVPQTRDVRYSARYEARIDAETHAQLTTLAATFHRKRSAIVRSVMQWGLAQTRGWTVDVTIPGMVYKLSPLLEPDLLQQVQAAAAAQGVSVAAWVREAMRRISVDNFPATWHAAAGEGANRNPMTRLGIADASCCDWTSPPPRSCRTSSNTSPSHGRR
jgi:hypothetical protein